MPSASSQLELTSTFVDSPVPFGYGFVRGAGKRLIDYVDGSSNTYQVRLLGEGQWKSLERLWLNRAALTLPDTTKVRFHPGLDGTIGAGMSATSTGGDQLVDSFFSSLPASLNTYPVTWSRYAYLFLKIAPDAGAPDQNAEVLGDYKAGMVRLFDNTGAQTGFDWSQNWVWITVDQLLRKFVLREARINQPLTSEQKARFDFGLLKAAADYSDFDIGGGVKRFSGEGVVWIEDGLGFDRALEQLLLLCRSYLLEANGKMSVNEKRDRASTFTFKRDDIEPGSFEIIEAPEPGFNQVTPRFRNYDRMSGSSDDLTRFFDVNIAPVNHEAHQRAMGFAARGLARSPRAIPFFPDVGVNTGERAWRLVRPLLLEELGDEPDPGNAYVSPLWCQFVGLPQTLEAMPGDVVTVDSSITEEFGGLKWVVISETHLSGGRHRLKCRQHNPNAFPDVAPTQQVTLAA